MDELYNDTEENWASTYRGINKTGYNSFIKVAILIAPKGRDYHTSGLILLVYSTIVQWILLYSGFITLFKASHDLILFIEISHYYSILLAIHILFMEHFIFKMKKSRQIFQVMDIDIYDYGTDFDRSQIENSRLKTAYYMPYVRKGIYACLGLTGIILAVLPLVQLARGVEKTRDGILVILPVPFWFPFNTETSLGFALAYFFELNMIAFAVFYLGTYFPFIIHMMVEIISHFRILNHSFLTIDERTSAMYGTVDKDSVPGTSSSSQELMHLVENSLYERCYSECLRRNILHHKAILDFVELFQDVHSTLFGVLLGANMLVIAAITIVITKVEFSLETSKFYVMMVIELINVFIYCFLGTFITEEAKRVGITIYSTPWLSSSKRNRKLVQFVQLRVSHDVVLKGNGIFSLNLQLYIQIMQTSYSIFNLFNSVDT
ncbi:hypothetical protein LSTR_LSTR013262 [Laodelphax striatellus]|uniref:Odorant receptor n=1 Tax=Laodelphax striatellus TaxID=195883 RepID=A0A482X920_LAOST|nr:hypothetical protein LSTR_LSTR013262 [Laodelphax striatellus]